ncbi:MAG: T9SS type A sorting domain-containing protein, partial [Bacteroidota bacterium]
SADEMTVYIVGNFDVQSQTTNLTFPHAGTWYDYFSGSALAPLEVSNVNVTRTLRPGEFRVYTNFPLSAPVPELMPFVKPKAATDLAAASIGGTEIQLTWSDPSEISHIFRIYRATSAEGPFSQVSLIDAGTTSFTDSGLSPETQYFYYIATQSEVDTSNSAVFTVSTITSVEDEALAASIEMYPNPAPQKVRLSFENQITGSIQVQLWDARGNLIERFEVNKKSKRAAIDLDLPDLAQGLYLLRFQNGKGQATKRLVIE